MDRRAERKLLPDSSDDKPTVKQFSTSQAEMMEGRLEKLKEKPEDSPFSPNVQQKLLKIGVRAMRSNIFELDFPLKREN